MDIFGRAIEHKPVMEALNIVTRAIKIAGIGSVCHPRSYSVGAESGGKSQAGSSHREVAD
jgi:hypothetical protein